MKEWLKAIHGTSKREGLPTLRAGYDVRVYFTIREQGKERRAQFEGVVIRVRGSGPSRTFTVRRLTHGVGVERVFPLDGPIINRIEVLRRGKVKRSRLYFLRRVVKTTRLESAEEQFAPGDSVQAKPSSQPVEIEITPSKPAGVAADEKSVEIDKPAA